ncbi:hypothetical protein [Kitasatospora purpeofusca]|uniref:hypothetical protein n=1 Tax=Kitasatospora purpeofusca TaxID=67352 RepID=UPI0036D33E7C
MIDGSTSPPSRSPDCSPRRLPGRPFRRAVALLALLLVPAPAGLADAPRASALHPAGGEARGAVRLEVRTNGATGVDVRVRADEQLLRVYRLTNQAEYPLTVTTVTDAQVSGAAVVCGNLQPFTLPPLGVVECSATLPARSGRQRTEVRAEATAPKGMPKAVATAEAGYQGLVAGITLTRVGVPTGTGVVVRADRTARRELISAQAPAVGAPFLDESMFAGRRSLPMVVGGDIRLRYRVDAVGDSPISAVSVVDHLPGVGPVSCTGQSAGGLLELGRPLDCTASGEAVPGRHTAVARAEGLAVDGAVGQDGRPLAPLPVAAEAPGDYEGEAPVPAPPGGAANPAGPPPGTAPGAAANAAGANAPPPGPAAAAPPGAAANPAAAAAAGPAAPVPGTAAAAAAAAAAAGSAVPYRPGTSIFGLPASPFQAVAAAGAAAAAGGAGAGAGAAGAVGAAAGAGGAGAAGAAAAAGAAGGAAGAAAGAAGAAAAGGAAGGAGAGGAAAGAAGAAGAGAAGAGAAAQGAAAGGASGGAGAGSGSAGSGQPGQPGQSGSPNPRGNAASAAQIPDDTPFDWDDDWGADEVLMLLLSIVLPVLVVLAAALSVRQRRNDGPGGGGGE